MLQKLGGLLLLLCAALAGYSQTKNIDSLKNNITKAPTAQQQLQAIFALCEERQSFSADTLLHYLQQAEMLSKRINNPAFTQKEIRYYIAGYYMKTGKTDSVVRIINSFVYQLGKDSAAYQLQMKALYLKGNALIRGGRYKESLDEFYAVLQMAIPVSNHVLEVMTKNCIGWAYMDMEQHAIAINWFRQAMAAAKDTMLLERYSYVYANIASCYNDVARYDSAEYFILKALRGVRENQNLTALANVLNIQADIFINTKRRESAGKCLEEALAVRREIGDTFYLVSDIAQLAIYYANNNQTAKGISTAKEGIEIANRAGLNAKLLNLYEALALNYKNGGNYQQYSNMMEKIVLLKDSTYKENAVDAMAQLKATSDLKKNETELAAQHFAVNKKNIQLYGSVIILGLVVTVFYLLFTQSRQKEQVKLAQALAKEKRMAEQAVLTAEDNQRKRIAADLHDNLGVQANAILYGTELLIHENKEKELLVNNLHDTAKDMLVSLRETLWAMKTADVPAPDVWLRILNFSKQMQRYYQAISINTTGTAPAGFFMNSARALNAVLIVQEAVNNAARHSMAAVIVITSEQTDSHWQIEIKDDGKGFDITAMQQKNDSYGLTNMRERAAAAGLQLGIHTSYQSGTSILLQVPFVQPG